MYIEPIRINGQVYSYRDLRCGGEPRLRRVAGGMTAASWNNAPSAGHAHGVGQASRGMVPGKQEPNFSLSLYKEEWDYLMTSGLLRPQGFSDQRFDWELLYGQSEAGSISRLRLTNFHFLGVVGAAYRQGEALIHDIGCYVQFIEEDPGNGIYFAPVIPSFLVTQ